MDKKQKNLTTLEQFKDKNYGKRGTKKRDDLESGYENFNASKIVELGLGGYLELLIKL